MMRKKPNIFLRYTVVLPGNIIFEEITVTIFVGWDFSRSAYHKEPSGPLIYLT